MEDAKDGLLMSFSGKQIIIVIFEHIFSLQDTFFYSLVYDPQQKTLLADRGEIRVGNRYQAEATPLLKEGMITLKS